MTRIALVLSLMLAARGASAQQIPWVQVEVGKTIHIDTGRMSGVQCDNLDLIHVDLVTRNDPGDLHTELVVTGVEVGRTLCRVGTVVGTPTQLFGIDVITPE